MSGYDPNLVSNNILQRAFQENIPVTPMQLQKILYFTASEYAKATGNRLLSDDFSAWRYGPVNQDVYREFKPYGGKAIQSYAKDAAGNEYVLDEASDPALRETLERVWAHTKNKSAAILSRITHSVGSAWYQAYVARDATIGQELVAADTTYVRELGLR